MPRVDRSSRITSRWTDLQLARALRTREPGVLIGTRPGLNMLVASFAPPGWGRVGVEHLNLEAHRPRQRAPIRARYPALDALVVLTEADRAAYAEELGGAARVVCIPNAVPDLKGHPSQLEAPTVVAAGRLKRQKGFDLLVPAFARVAGRHPGWRLRICGSGPQRGALAEQVASHGLAGSIDLPGAVAEMGDELASASVFVLSSRFEGFPMVLLEAMSKGLPVVSFDCPTGPSEVVEHGVNGLLVPPGDVAALSDAIATMIEDEELRRRCGHAALATAARYGIDAVGRQWDDLVAEVGAASAPALSPPGRRRGSGPPPRSGRPPRPLPAAHHGEPGRAAPPARP
jgi:glycosyltransferase involved in cell wall biosynthesis